MIDASSLEAPKLHTKLWLGKGRKEKNDRCRGKEKPAQVCKVAGYK